MEHNESIKIKNSTNRLLKNVEITKRGIHFLGNELWETKIRTIEIIETPLIANSISKNKFDTLVNSEMNSLMNDKWYYCFEGGKVREIW